MGGGFRLVGLLGTKASATRLQWGEPASICVLAEPGSPWELPQGTQRPLVKRSQGINHCCALPTLHFQARQLACLGGQAERRDGDGQP